MTSTDFSYPQPTDDELAAQHPRNSAPHAPTIYSSPGAGPSLPGSEAGSSPSALDSGTGPHAVEGAAAPSPALGKTAMALSIVAMVLSVAASAILGATVGPTEAESGYYFTDTPGWYQTLATILVGLQALCTCLGITGVILGIVAAVTARGRTLGIVAIAVAAVAPFISFGTFVALSFAFA